MKPESRFWSRIRSKFPPGHIVRVENPVYPGTPDLNFVYRGREIWFELKYEPGLPAKPDTPVFTRSLRPEQVLWLITRAHHGGECYILAGADNQVFCIPGKFAERFNKFTLAELRQHTVKFPDLFKIGYNDKVIIQTQPETSHETEICSSPQDSKSPQHE